MKKLITTILTLIILTPLTVISQVIDWDNFDSHIADSVYFVEMNKFRDSLGLSTFVYSNVIHDNISLYVTNQMVKEKKAFHPDKTDLVKKYKSATTTEILNALDINTSYNPPLLVGPWEVGSFIFVKMGETYKFTTYKEVAQYIIKNLCRSTPHHKIITSEYGKIKRAAGIGSGSIQLGEDQKIYSTFHISTLYYNN